jgi:tetratricopeptide (TPR) repeat protein
MNPQAGDTPAALARARALLGPRPNLALAEAAAVLRTAPQNAEARLLSAAARRRRGDFAGAREGLTALAAAHPTAWGVQYEAGAALAALGETQAAIGFLRQACRLNPRSSLAWHALGDQLDLAGDAAGVQDAHGRQVPGAVGDDALVEAAAALLDSRSDAAASALAGRFNMHLTDLMSVSLIADAGLRTGRHEAVERLLADWLDRAPAFQPIRQRHAIALSGHFEAAQALQRIEPLLAQHPKAFTARGLKAALLTQTGDHDQAAGLYAELLADAPDQPRLWLSYGHVLKTLGRQADCVSAYRRGLALDPGLGEAYWSLANLKVVAFGAADLAAMRGLLDRDDLDASERVAVHFALAKALEDSGAFEESFTHYSRGNGLRRAEAPYDAQAHHGHIERLMATFTPAFFAARAGSGSASCAPIFIVGLPRSGSTLVEQILASHSQVEGLSELPDLTAIAAGLAREAAAEGLAYPASLAALDLPALQALGEAYLARAAVYRKLDRPRFVDKFPGNLMHLGLIQLILPKARIIDVRRHPMACCLSGFKQLFAQGQDYSYDLADLGRYYADYLALTAHFDAVAPGRVHTLAYEDLVGDPPTEIRRLLAYCGLEFEDACLNAHESRRPVRTASSEQVRRPISGHGLQHWRQFEPWLAPLKAALGPAADPRGPIRR